MITKDTEELLLQMNSDEGLTWNLMKTKNYKMINLMHQIFLVSFPLQSLKNLYIKLKLYMIFEAIFPHYISQKKTR